MQIPGMYCSRHMRILIGETEEEDGVWEDLTNARLDEIKDDDNYIDLGCDNCGAIAVTAW